MIDLTARRQNILDKHGKEYKLPLLVPSHATPCHSHFRILVSIAGFHGFSPPSKIPSRQHWEVSPVYQEPNGPRSFILTGTSERELWQAFTLWSSQRPCSRWSQNQKQQNISIQPTNLYLPIYAIQAHGRTQCKQSSAEIYESGFRTVISEYQLWDGFEITCPYSISLLYY